MSPHDADVRVTTPVPADPLASALSLARALRDLLEEERRAATVAEAGALEKLVARKRRLLDALEALQPALGRAMESDDERGRASREALRAALADCREQNLENGVAVRTAGRHVRSALELLRGTLALDDLTLYDERGRLEVRRERRRFGQA